MLSAEAVTPLTEVSENDPYSSLRRSVFSATTQATTGNTFAVRRLRYSGLKHKQSSDKGLPRRKYHRAQII